MSLAPGTRFGTCEIRQPLGKGGMGEVYVARDTKLNRDVAIKVLPDELAADAERLARFEREAQTLAALNHPHIAQIYGVAEGDGNRPALIMELVDGEDLAGRLTRGAIPVDEAIPIALQTADALEAAHEAGIVHRDLKPANIKVRDDGTVKVLDFGLAKALEPAGDASSADAINSPTITTPAMTMRGVVLGTAAYMSPEQAKGKRVDRRADIWAFGCVLFEMLAGRRPFTGDDTSDTLAAIFRAEPPWELLPGSCPPAVRRVLRRCLEKDPARRLKHIGDARYELDDSARHGDGDSTREAPGPAVSARKYVWGSAAMVAAMAAAAIIFWPRPSPSRDVIDLSIPLPQALPLRVAAGGTRVLISPDGQRVVYTAGLNDQLVLRRMDDPDPIVLPARGLSPFFSDDSKWIGYRDGDELKRLNLDGGLPSTICKWPRPAASSWGDDGTIIIASDGELFSVPGSGGTPVLIRARQADSTPSSPFVLPGSDVVLFEDVQASPPVIRALRLSNQTVTEVIQGGSPQMIGDDVLLFERQDALWASRFDVKSATAIGEPVAVLRDVRRTTTGSINAAIFSASRTGSLAYSPGASMPRSTLVWLDRTGRSEPTVVKPGGYLDPQFSPDGRRVVVTIVAAGVSDAWIFDLERGAGLRLTTDGARRPRWSSGGRIAYESAGPAAMALDIFVRGSDGAGERQILLSRPASQFPDSWAPDGRTLVYNEGGATRDLWAVTEGQPPVRLLPASSFNERGGRVSPDGKWLAFVSNESGRDEVYVQPFPGPGPRTAISTDGGRQPIWSRDSRELFYRAEDNLMSVPITSSPFRAGTPKVLFEMSRQDYGDDPNRVEYDVGPDGRFIAVRMNREDRPEEIRVVINWIERFKRRNQ